ncbi:GP-PDE domain-containing protein OS=Streptomyces microflavus OX=1919 GN=Smic_81140 PE=4 SV=1 [Streptomyces microflavus]
MDMQPTDWAYVVSEKFADIAARTYAIRLPADVPVVSIADIAPSDPSTGQDALFWTDRARGCVDPTGTGTPSPMLGGDGDMFVDKTVGAVKLYGPKASGAWPAEGVALGGGGLIASVNGQTGTVSLTASDVGALPRAIKTVSALTAQSLFYIAHRGSGAELGAEHTLDAYEAAVAAGAQAIEVSVRMTADGVLVCGHDESLERTTYSTGDITAPR